MTGTRRTTETTHGDTPSYHSLLFLGTIALAAFLWWISDLTAGPEYGGRYDLPAVNGAAWFGFLASIPAVLVVGGLWMARVDSWVDARRQRRGLRRGLTDLEP